MPSPRSFGLVRDDLLDVDDDGRAVELLDVRDRARLGRVEQDVLALADDAVADTEREQRLGDGRRERHDPPRLGRDDHRGALVVGEGDREGRGLSRRGGGGRGVGRRRDAGRERSGGSEGRCGGRCCGAGAEKEGRREGEQDGERTKTSDHGNSGRAVENQQTPWLRGEARGQAVDRTGTPDLSLEGSSGDGGSATGLPPPQGAVTVAGLCRNHTGFATIPRRICGDLGSR
jgi:hypothetical protein